MHAHTHAYAHTRRNSRGGKSRAFKINNAMRHEHAGYNSGRRLPPRVQPNRAGGEGQSTLPPSSVFLPPSACRLEGSGEGVGEARTTTPAVGARVVF